MGIQSGNIIYHLFGQPVDWIKRTFYNKKLNEKYLELSKNNNVIWDSNKANAFQHAYKSATLAYDFNEQIALELGLFVEFATWSRDIYDINKDMTNNKIGIEIGKNAKIQNLTKDEIAEIIFNNIQNNDAGFIIDPTTAPLIYKVRDDVMDEILNIPKRYFEDFIKVFDNILCPPAGAAELFNDAEDKNCKKEDPLIFDLNNDSVLSTTDIDNGVYFDHENDGFAEVSAWVGRNDGILVIDTNNNGEIENGTELVTADNIAEYDTNEDGIIDSNDTNFNNLKILKGDGILLTLAEAGIASINLSTTNVGIPDENGNEQVYEATFTRTDGTTGKYGEFLVNTETSNSIAIEWLDETEEISELPDIAGSGTIYSLHQAMLRDVSGDLQELVEDFVSETNDSVRQSLVDQILYKWADVGAINPSSRGVYVNAQHLSVLEAFMGRIFASHAESVDVGCECGEHCYCNEPNMPNPNQGQMLETAYQQLRTNIYAELMSQSHNSTLLDDIEIDFDTDKQQFVFNLDAITTQLQQAIAQDAIAGKAQAVQFVTTLKGLGLDKYSNYFDPFDDNCLYTALTQNDRELKWQFDTIGKIPFVDETGEGEGTSGDDYFRAEDGENSHFHALTGDDVMYGGNQTDNFYACSGDDLLDGGDGDDVLDSHGGNDIIFAGAGNDIIHASDGDDIIFGDAGDDIIYPDHGDDFSYAEDGDDIIRGGTGNDTIISMVGNDTFIFNLGDGQDTIIERQGVDTLYFGTGIEWEDLIFTRDDDDMVISIDGTTDQITVKDWFLTSGEDYQFDNNKIEIFKFADDDEIHYKDEILVGNNTESVLYNMADLDNDYFELPSNYKTTINLKSGWNHIVEGSNSNDTFVLSEEGTYVLIQNYSGENTIQFGQGITLANTVFEIDEEGLQISFKDFDAHITIQGDLDADTSIEFYDETVITDIKDYIRTDVSYYDYTMHTNQEELTLLGSNDINAVGNNLNNTIRGNYGDTTFEGAGGNDRLESEFGGDDTYIYNLGDGTDTIFDLNGNDTIEFGQGITTTNIRFLKDLSNNNLEIFFDVQNHENDRIIIENYFNNDNKNQIENFVFYDESTLTASDVATMLIAHASDEDLTLASTITEAHLRGEDHISATGNSLDNVILGNNGDNTMSGGAGDDTFIDDCKTAEKYIYNLGDGEDTIIDIGGLDALIFGSGITVNNISFAQDNDNLVITFANNNDDSVTIVDYFADDDNKIELFKFSDGSIIDNIAPYLDNQLQNVQNDSIVMTDVQETLTLTGSSNSSALGNALDNTITGNSGNNTYHGGGGDDTFTDAAGNDTYYYNLNNGDDVITDQSGLDKIIFGLGITPDNIRFDQVDDDLIVSFTEHDGSITVKNYFLNDNYKIERFEFDNGQVITSVANLLKGISTATNYSMQEETIIDTVKMSGTGNISVEGNSDNNTIIGNSGNNTFEGKEGEDALIDHDGGNDTYIYNLGDGWDYIDDIGGTDTIQFGEGITTENIRFMQHDGNLDIWFEGEEGGLTIESYFSNLNNKIENLVFYDNTTITNVSNYLTGIVSESSITLPANVEQAILEGESNINATGNSLNNYIEGNAGNNTITGGQGDDYMADYAGGNDTYVYNLGDGDDTISDFGGYDTLRFGANITQDNLVFIFNNGSLLINFKDSNGDHIQGSVRIENYFYDDNKRIEKIEFANGSSITNFDNKLSILAGENDLDNWMGVREIHLWGDGDYSVTGSYDSEVIYGNSGDNTYNPRGGNDEIYDVEGGNDTYIYNHDYENKYIVDIGGNDTMKFGAGIDVEHTKFIRNNDNLMIYFPDNANKNITISNYFDTNEDNKIERFEFADGTIYTDEDIDDLISGVASNQNITLQGDYTNGVLLGDGDISATGNDEDNYFYGNSGDNTYNGGKGRDSYTDKQGGDDTYIYNIGDDWDWLVDIGGTDTIRFGQGITVQDVVFRNNHNNLDIKVKIENNQGGIFVDGYFKSNQKRIERFEFFDGTVLTDLTNYITGITVDTNYTIAENSQIRDLYLKGNGDLSVVGNSEDNEFNGNLGNNTYQGNGGNDNVYDEGGNDTYIYNLGDGFDFITDLGGSDTIRFGQGITTSNLRMRRQDNGNLEIYFDGEEGNVVIQDYFNNNANKIERIILSDNTEITNFTPYFTFVETDTNYTLPTNNNVIEDIIATGNGNISLTGNDNDNHFFGNSGNNTFQGNGGNDRFEDFEGGNDTYIYNLGDGFDSIYDENGVDTISFGQGITLDDVDFHQGFDSLGVNIHKENYDGNIWIDNFFNSDNSNKIERFEFNNGTVITDVSNYITSIDVDSNYTIAENSQIRGVNIQGDGDVSVTGNSSDNWFDGNSGDNTFQGNGGNDNFHDEQGGNDTYIYNLGDGFDFITDLGGSDTIRFGQGITTSNLRMRRQDNGNLEIYFDGEQGNIVIDNYFNNNANKIERIVLSDNTEITNFTPYFTFVETDTNYTIPTNSIVEDVYAIGNGNISLTGNANYNHFFGNSGNNTYQGNGGNDNFQDVEGGNDTYIYNLGDGWDFLYDENGIDTIQFGQGISVEDMDFQKNGNSLVLNVPVANNQGNIWIENFFDSSNINKIERIEFYNGTVITDVTNYITSINVDSNYTIPQNSSIRNVNIDGNDDISVTGNASDNWFNGNSGNNTIQGNGGNDYIVDTQGGNDTYIYNLGDGFDFITDIGGSDTIRFGQGITTSNLRMRKQDNGNLEIYFDGEQGNIVVQDYFNNNTNKIERIILSDNTEITNFTPYFTFIETDTNYTIPANSIVEDVYATGSGNISLTGNANDNHFFGNSGNNTYQGNGGNDNFQDLEGGNDTYIYNLGDGNDYINDLGGNDTLMFGSGITLNNLAFMQTSDNLNIWFHDSDGGISIENYFTNQNKRIENFVLSDNTTITDISNYITAIGSEESIILPNGVSQAHLWGTGNISATGNSMDNWIGGNSGNNTIQGNGGDDYIWDDQGGNDTYIYNLGDGNDFIHDEYGSDTIQFGQGISTSDVSFVHHSSSNDLEVHIGNNGVITIGDYFTSDVNKIETFEFADNSVITNITSLITEINDSQPQNSPELEPLGELEPLDVNQLIQEMNSYGIDNEVLMTNTQNQHEELLLVMGS